jgi:hypothetical protein
VRASLEVLEALAGALRLTPAERGHLILLGRGEQAPPCKPPAEKVSAVLKRLVENLGPGPAYIAGRRFDMLAWNPATAAVFGDPAAIPRATRNQLWLMFMDPARRELFGDEWERNARVMVAKFRADSARYIGDPAFEQLVSSLRGSSSEFRRWWERHEVAGPGEGRKVLNHPVVGKLVFDHAVFRHFESTELRLILYSPSCEEDTPAKLAQLLEAAPAR